MVRIACATDDGKNFTRKHFGEAEYYAIYDIDKDSVNYIEKIKNDTIECEEEEEKHGDAIKAKHVMMLLKMKNVEAVINTNFGPNIQRIKLRFVPVVIHKKVINEGIREVQNHYIELKKEHEKGRDRNFIIIREK